MKKMKKDNFMKGAMIATLCLVFSKILGIIYVIPFHAIIGKSGRALYGYAYNMYALFLNLSTVGLPLAISKIVSEYNALEDTNAKKKSYKVALVITLILAVISTLALFFLAPMIAESIMGGATGGNSKEDIIFVLRVSTTAILFVTIISTMRGYMQGHKYISYSSISDVLEQFVRVLVIVIGSYIMMKLFGTKEAVGIAVFGATVGALAALVYLGYHMYKVWKEDKPKETTKKDQTITSKELVKKLFGYAIPFVLISIVVSLCNTIDMMTLVKTLVNSTGMATGDAETVLSVISTWGAKLNVIVTSIASGLVVSVLPNITGDYTKGNMAGVRSKINKTLQILLFLVLPMVAGLSTLADPVWTIFYEKSELCISVFHFSVVTALFYSIYLNLNVIMQSLNRYKIANVGLVLCLIIKLCLNVPMILLFSKLGLPAYYGATLTTIIAYLVPITISLVDLKKSFQVTYKDTIKIVSTSFLGTVLMVIVLYLLSMFYPMAATSRIDAIIKVVVYAVVGASIYFLVAHFTHSFESVFGNDFKKKLFGKLKRRKQSEEGE